MERRIIFIDRNGQVANHQTVAFTTRSWTRKEKESYSHLHSPICPLAPSSLMTTTRDLANVPLSGASLSSIAQPPRGSSSTLEPQIQPHR